MNVREHEKTKLRISGKLQTLFGDFLDIETNDAVGLFDWFCEKANLYKTKYTGVNYRELPSDLKQGDIVLVRLGINVGTELSDVGENSNGHFGIVWGRQGQQFIIIPLTKSEQPHVNKYGVELGVIDGLPKIKLNDGTFKDRIAYAKIDAIRSVHASRVRKIMGVGKEGKISIKDTDMLQKISDKFKEYFVLNIDNTK